ncbi:MAG: hypothetical protein NT069_19350 [Planctomycetota bacterium]|nr:hypothetical protein [Planctomycetota bacterium]
MNRRAACAMLLALASGCAGTKHTQRIALPSNNLLKAEQLQVVSDFKIERDHPVITDLKRLRMQISETLDLPLGTKPVVVYLFANELEYTQYLQTKFPNFPSRRAYFMETYGKDLSVYTWWGDQIQEDLRHEYTHGLLHAGLTNVPLWLDEGLAEYFEVGGALPGQVNNEHAQLLVVGVQRGAWRPDLARLEYLEQVQDMKRADYREAWAWVHFMLHSSPDTRMVLLEYLQELRTNPEPGPLRERLVAVSPDIDQRLLVYVAGLNGPGHWNASFLGSGNSTVRAVSH